MAKVKYSGVAVVDMSGKLGGSVLTKNRAGAAVRNWSKPNNPQSGSQQLNRVEFAAISSVWRSLTEAQRHAWDSQASNYRFKNVWGDNIRPAGNALHEQLNKNLLQAGQSVIADPVSPVAVANPLSLTITTNTDIAQVLTLDAAVAADTSILVFATPPLSAGIQAFKGKYRLISTFAAAHAAALDTFADYSAKFGAPITGSKIGFYVIAISTLTGQAGVPLNNSGITA